ncbi:MAG: N-acetyl-gamma-glutamyl-phosphate reductase [Oscillospiraceae bacterium]|nr:N-acetyl-gamma-glutamyl-phosphate reductase [Oscillospiraceae bacterium]
MKPKVFIDGESGTVGLQIHQRLENRTDIELLKIAPELSENADERAKFLNEADFVFLCLPDDIAKQSVSLIENTGNTRTRIIDASTAHRTNSAWDYGFPELSTERANKISKSKRVANPGCYASGFIALVYPLVQCGILPKDSSLFCYGVSGYSGAGKAFIEEYQNPSRNPELTSSRLYALGMVHKHQPEMQITCELEKAPMFTPMIDDYYSGSFVSVPLFGLANMKASADEIKAIYREHYNLQTNSHVRFKDGEGMTFLAGNTLADTDDMVLYVFADESNERILLTAQFDNLGKGASGAAVQCFDLMLANMVDYSRLN